jgi:OmpA-OmpF porin, OOP family
MEASANALTEVKALLDSKPEISLVRIEVHTDSMGSEDANLALSAARALFVARALADRGVSCERVIPVGFGETKPIAPNTTAEDRARNRRTELVVVGLRGKIIGSLPADGGGLVAGDPCN